jgi:hypothetical protein
MKNDDTASYYIDRLSVFEDSQEIADHYQEQFEDAGEEGDYDYWAAETRDHILGLWSFAKECVEKIKEMERAANEQL